MVAIYIAGLVILFAVATVVYKVVYKAAARLVMKSRPHISATKSDYSSPVPPDILLGSSHRLSQSDLLLENMALRQELSALRAHNPKSRKGTPENGSGLDPTALAQLKASPDHRHNGNGRALAQSGSQGNFNR